MKIITIEGMNCSKCQARIENVLKTIDGVKKVTTDLKLKCAKVKGEVEDIILKEAIVSAGYKVIDIKEKKGLFC